MKTVLLTFTALLTLIACGAGGVDGDSCTSDADCADGLECHIEEHDDTAAHEDEEEHEETGVCEDHEDHDHE
jgi:hypothetical protein